MPSKLNRQIEAVAISEINKLLAKFKTRVFNQGKAANGSPIGQYSNKPLYVSVSKEGSRYKTRIGSQIDNTRLKPRGKANDSPKFKNGKPRKSSYFGGGYKEFRQAVKRQNGYVDLNLSGQLFFDVRVFKIRGGFLEIAIQNRDSIDKARGNEKRFSKDIFSISEKEAAATIEKISNIAADLAVKAFFR